MCLDPLNGQKDAVSLGNKHAGNAYPGMKKNNIISPNCMKSSSISEYA
jgi:hypothetical protein